MNTSLKACLNPSTGFPRVLTAKQDQTGQENVLKKKKGYTVHCWKKMEHLVCECDK